MGELKFLIIGIAVASIIALGVYAFDNLPDIMPEGYRIEGYEATLHSDGTLNESFFYRINDEGGYHMLYRSWRSPVEFTHRDECVVPLNMSIEPEGAIGYAEASGGEVRFYGSNASYPYVMQKAERNEVGFYMPSGFSRGEYRINYSYRIYPNIKYDGEHYLLRMSFKDNGKSYHRMTIKIEDRGNIAEVRAPEIFHVTHRGRYWYVELYDRWGINTEVYIIMDSLGNMSHNRVVRVDDVYSEVNWDLTLDSIGFYGLYLPYVAIKWIIYLFPLFIVVGYLLYGREKKVYDVEKGRITPPVRRKPWIVNLVFKNEGEGIDSDAFLSTLLDLRRRGKIEFKDGKIRIIDENIDDPYEMRVLDFIYNFQDEDGFDPTWFKDLLKSMDYKNPDYSRAKEALSDIRTAGKKEEERITKEFLWIPRKVMMMLLPIPILLMIIELIFLPIASRYAIFYFLIMMFALAFMGDLWAAFSHPSLLGKWKNDYYREKLEWDSFRDTLKSERFAENIAEHSSLWEDWLIYGTALGVGDKVKKAMEEAGISGDTLDFYNQTVHVMAYIYVGGPSSGGGVGGGGFGGGGGGAR